MELLSKVKFFLKLDDWEKVPEVADYTVHKRKQERYTPVSDSLISSGLNDNQLVNAIDPLSKSHGTATPIGQASGNLNEVGQAKNKVLSYTFDKMSSSVSGQTSVNPVGYLTEMNTITTNPIGDISDIKKAKSLIQCAINTNSENPAAWIAAARLEELDGKLSQARGIIVKALETIEDSEDLWMEAARLHVIYSF